DVVCSEIRHTLANLQLLIIDEISMVSNVMLAYIHLRLSQVFKSADLFGGRNVLAMGDLAQLKPVSDRPVFVPLTVEQITSRIGGLYGGDIWKLGFTRYDELTRSMRQQEDERFSSLLSRLRYGQLTQED